MNHTTWLQELINLNQHLNLGEARFPVPHPSHSPVQLPSMVEEPTPPAEARPVVETYDSAAPLVPTDHVTLLLGGGGHRTATGLGLLDLGLGDRILPGANFAQFAAGGDKLTLKVAHCGSLRNPDGGFH